MKKYIILTILLLIASLNFNVILKPLGLVTGGTQGITLVLNEFIKFKPSTIIFIINITTLILSYIFLNKEVTKGTIAASIIYPFAVKSTSYIDIIVPKNYLLFSIIAGVVCGLTGGYIYKLGFSSGGVSTINLLVNKFTKIKIGICNFIINTIIIVFGMILFGVVKGLYSILVILISSIIIYKITKNLYAH